MQEPEGDLEAIHDALDRGDPLAALQLIEDGLGRDAGDPELRTLAGVALEGLGRPHEAVRHLRLAVELVPGDPDCRALLARALFSSGQFAAAERETERVLALDPDHPDGLEVRGLLWERQGRHADADRCFSIAARMEPDRFPLPVRLTRRQFDDALAAAASRLPEAFREHLDEVVVVVEPLPSDSLVQGQDPALDPETLGLFDGVPLGESSGAELPARIFLFQRNLERLAAHTDLGEEIAVTLYHELGHYLGLEEDEVEDIGLG